MTERILKPAETAALLNFIIFQVEEDLEDRKSDVSELTLSQLNADVSPSIRMGFNLQQLCNY